MVLNNTVCSASLGRRISDWRVSEEHSLSDHRQILFWPERQLRVQVDQNPRHTFWSEYRNHLKRNFYRFHKELRAAKQ